MHLVKDENGNVCAHAHSHTHSHTHEGGLNTAIPTTMNTDTRMSMTTRTPTQTAAVRSPAGNAGAAGMNIQRHLIRMRHC